LHHPFRQRRVVEQVETRPCGDEDIPDADQKSIGGERTCVLIVEDPVIGAVVDERDQLAGESGLEPGEVERAGGDSVGECEDAEGGGRGARPTAPRIEVVIRARGRRGADLQSGEAPSPAAAGAGAGAG
jgi:hypothetical protein